VIDYLKRIKKTKSEPSRKMVGQSLQITKANSERRR